jgi:hypothetical protein
MASTQATKVLSSDWGGLNPLLIASFYPVERVLSADGKSERWQRVPDSTEVRAPLTEFNMEHTANWNSPFENTGADQKFSSVSALLQAGALAPLMAQLQSLLKTQGADASALSSVSSLEGRSSVTKLNSRQIYNGTPPYKLTGTAQFKAFADAYEEVEAPVNQLVAWNLPKMLAADGPVLSLLMAGSPSLYPSEVPQIIGMSFAGMQFLPLVIETCSYPIGGPRTSKGHLIEAPVQLSIASLSAIDKGDWAGFTTRETK